MKFIKVITRIAVFSFLALLIFCVSASIYCYHLTKNVKLSKEKLQLSTQKIVFCDAFGEEIESSYLSKGEPLSTYETPNLLKKAFVSIEDKRFYSHRGIDVKRVIGAAISNIKNGKYKEGASTITQQLIKNTHLNSEKTMKRKLSEMKLALLLEKEYEKDEILTMYLNHIYFGENCYGVKTASKRYFNKDPKDLSVAECATLAAIIKAPTYYSPLSNPNRCLQRRNLVLREMQKQGYIDQKTYTDAIHSPLNVCTENTAYAKDYLKEAMNEVETLLPFPLFSYGNTITIFTGLEPKTQEILEELQFSMPENAHFSAITLNNERNLISAFRSTTGLAYRQSGSTLKPLAVYGPAIEQNFIDESTLILDAPISYSGYQPKNYKDQYHGYVSAKYALAHSLNVPSVKILDGIGVKTASKTLTKLGFPLTEKDNSLTLGLGATQKGISLKHLVNGYAAIAKKGIYEKGSFVHKILADSQTIYLKKAPKTRVFSEETAFLLTDMLKESVISGTAKKLSHLPFSVAAKTGTVGSTSGNTDAYTLSYTEKQVVGVWFGANKGEMNNTISGGNLPATISMEIWRELSQINDPGSFSKSPNGIEKIALHKPTYDNDLKEILAKDTDGEANKLYTYYKKERVPQKRITDEQSNLPQKSEFLEVKIDNFNVCIVLCVREMGKFSLFREEIGNTPSPKIEKICTLPQTTNAPITLTDNTTTPGKTYRYFIAESAKDRNDQTPYSKAVTVPYSF